MSFRSAALAILAVAAIECVALTYAAGGATPAIARSNDVPPEILVSRQLFESQRLTVGETVSLSTDPRGAGAREVRVAGVYEPVPDPMRLGAVRLEIRMHLPDLIGMTAAASRDPQQADEVDALNVAIARPAGVEPFARRIESRLPGVVARSTTGDDQRAAPFIVLERFHLAIAIVTVIASSIFLLALMLMLVDERRSTVGILRLIGFRRRRIVQFVLAEGAVIAAAGAVFGIVLAAALQDGINRFFQWRYDTALVFVRVTPPIALQSIAIAVPLGVAAAVLASWSLLRREVFTLTRR
jgi:putative ABC transport system permease protein